MLPFIWTHLLFPGTAATGEKRPGVLSLLLLLAIPAILLYPCLSFHLFEPDEGRYAEIPREMLVRGEWVVPYLEGEPYLDKPPLLYWLVGLSYRVLGIHVWAARLIPALAVHGSILVTYLLGRRSLGERAAFWGALLLALAPGFTSIGRLLVLDSLLTFWVTLSIFSSFEAIRGRQLRWGWWLTAAVACGLGILTKGPVAVLLLVPPLWAHRRLAGSSSTLSWSALATFGAMTTCVALPWYVAISLKLPGFARYFLWEHNVVRFLAPFDHRQPVWFYLPILLLGLLPATLFAWPLVRYLTTLAPASALRRTPELGFVLLVGGWCVLFFSLSGCKLPTYILPAFPPLSLAFGAFLAGSGMLRSRWPGLATAASFGLLCAGHHLLLPWYTEYRAPVAHVTELQQVCTSSEIPIICYPRDCDSVAFYLGRDDLRGYRSKETHLLVYFLQTHPRTVLLLTHRHSLQNVRYALPPELCIVEQRHFGLAEVPGLPTHWAERLTGLMGETSLGLCDLVVVEHRQAGR
jgi:4-amino-4-deoxy-L-arabinose transferase-like glycosyltransferase